MRVGLAMLPTNPARAAGEAAVPDSRVYEEDLRLGLLAEELGFDSLWTVEHHFSPLTIVPNPLQFLTYFAGATRRLDLGTMVIVLPWHDPIRVAEEIAVLDNMLQGRRLTVGLGRGTGTREFEGMRVPVEESRERFLEALEILRRALGSESFSHRGRHHAIPEVTVRPRPRSADLLERMCVAALTSDSVPDAAATGLGLLVGNQKPWEQTREDVVRFNAARAERGWDAVRPTALVSVMCADDESEAWTRVRRHWGEQLGSIATHYERPQRSAEELDAAARLQAWGTPEQVLAKLERVRRDTDAAEAALMFRCGAMPAAVAERSMRLFAAEVLPAIRGWEDSNAAERQREAAV
jgi:alkanesulfonate monooxygenase SsuD/methylene tetrahydromethanopterin reductase-like flavin-dependent oxidoreductase (luciferase family)